MAAYIAVDLLNALPWSLRRDTERYLTSVRENALAIFHDAGVAYTAERLEQLLVLAAIQKTWATVSSQAWIVDSALGARNSEAADGAPGISGLRLGSAIYSRASAEYRDLHRLRRALDALLGELEIRDVIRRSSLIGLARALERQSTHGR